MQVVAPSLVMYLITDRQERYSSTSPGKGTTRRLGTLLSDVAKDSIDDAFEFFDMENSYVARHLRCSVSQPPVLLFSKLHKMFLDTLIQNRLCLWCHTPWKPCNQAPERYKALYIYFRSLKISFSYDSHLSCHRLASKWTSCF